MLYDNEMTIIIDSKSQNEALARITVAAFASQLDPTVSEITDIKTVVSEAVTNAIIHGYEGGEGKVYINCKSVKNEIVIEIWDEGIGIENIEEAMTPLFTSKLDMERSGMGFTVMETFMDSIKVESTLGKGTKIIMSKSISCS